MGDSDDRSIAHGPRFHSGGVAAKRIRIENDIRILEQPVPIGILSESENNRTLDNNHGEQNFNSHDELTEIHMHYQTVPTCAPLSMTTWVMTSAIDVRMRCRNRSVISGRRNSW